MKVDYDGSPSAEVMKGWKSVSDLFDRFDDPAATAEFRQGILDALEFYSEEHFDRARAEDPELD